jgi:hypothetical protein
MTSMSVAASALLDVALQMYTTKAVFQTQRYVLIRSQ